MKRNRALGSKKSNILTLAGIVSFLMVNYSMSLSIINRTSLYAKVSVEHGDPQCFDYKEVLVKPQESVNITSSCPVKKITAQMFTIKMVPFPREQKVANAVPYEEKNATDASLNFHIVRDKKYAIADGFGIEKI